MSSKQETKRRIKSVEATQKITNAMELVATAKLKKVKKQMEQTKVYSEMVFETVSNILSQPIDFESPFLMKNGVSKKLIIFMTSTIGLCGGYNNNTLKLLRQESNHDDEVIVIGTRGAEVIRDTQLQVIERISHVNELTPDLCQKVMKQAISRYTMGFVGSIQLIYTEYVNPLTFEPRIIQLLPVVPTKQLAGTHKELVFEPSAKEVLDYMIPMYLNSVLFGRLIESQTSEQASRRNAMESATDNAEDLREQLLLEYNRARQASITQEISEIVAGASAQ